MNKFYIKLFLPFIIINSIYCSQSIEEKNLINRNLSKYKNIVWGTTALLHNDKKVLIRFGSWTNNQPKYEYISVHNGAKYGYPIFINQIKEFWNKDNTRDYINTSLGSKVFLLKKNTFGTIIGFFTEIQKTIPLFYIETSNGPICTDVPRSGFKLVMNEVVPCKTISTKNFIKTNKTELCGTFIDTSSKKRAIEEKNLINRNLSKYKNIVWGTRALLSNGKKVFIRYGEYIDNKPTYKYLWIKHGVKRFRSTPGNEIIGFLNKDNTRDYINTSLDSKVCLLKNNTFGTIISFYEKTNRSGVFFYIKTSNGSICTDVPRSGFKLVTNEVAPCKTISTKNFIKTNKIELWGTFIDTSSKESAITEGPKPLKKLIESDFFRLFHQNLTSNLKKQLEDENKNMNENFNLKKNKWNKRIKQLIGQINNNTSNNDLNNRIKQLNKAWNQEIKRLENKRNQLNDQVKLEKNNLDNAINQLNNHNNNLKQKINLLTNEKVQLNNVRKLKKFKCSDYVKSYTLWFILMYVHAFYGYNAEYLAKTLAKKVWKYFNMGFMLRCIRLSSIYNLFSKKPLAITMMPLDKKEHKSTNYQELCTKADTSLERILLDDFCDGKGRIYNRAIEKIKNKGVITLYPCNNNSPSSVFFEGHYLFKFYSGSGRMHESTSKGCISLSIFLKKNSNIVTDKKEIEDFFRKKLRDYKKTVPINDFFDNYFVF